MSASTSVNGPHVPRSSAAAPAKTAPATRERSLVPRRFKDIHSPLYRVAKRRKGAFAAGGVSERRRGGASRRGSGERFPESGRRSSQQASRRPVRRRRRFREPLGATVVVAVQGLEPRTQRI